MVNGITNKTAYKKLRGEWVLPGVYFAGDFIKKMNTRVGHNSYFDGSWEELEALVTAHKDDWVPGVGAVDGDVRLVNVPAEGFFSAVIAIDDTNRHLVTEEEYVRMEGEAPVITRRIVGVKPAARYVQVVVYRADVLAQDNDRTTDAEWEIITILAQDVPSIPMDPKTMLRNANNEKGGTFREYTQEEWAASYAYWDGHAYINQVE